MRRLEAWDVVNVGVAVPSNWPKKRRMFRHIPHYLNIPSFWNSESRPVARGQIPDVIEAQYLVLAGSQCRK